MKNIKALTFDVGGTVFDWKTAVRTKIDSIASARNVDVDSEEFALAWRLKMFMKLGEVRSKVLPWMNADELHRFVLDDLAAEFPQLELSEEDLDELPKVWHQMKAWPDFSDALLKLQERYHVAVLTILSLSIAVDCSKLNNIHWDAILSCEFLGHYKPDIEAYQRGCKLLGFEPSEVLMVASHPLDLLAAKGAGLHTAFVEPNLNEPDLPGFSGEIDSRNFDLVATDFTELAEILLS
jgi:2-haloacid dehalogenase